MVEEKNNNLSFKEHIILGVLGLASTYFIIGLTLETINPFYDTKISRLENIYKSNEKFELKFFVILLCSILAFAFFFQMWERLNYFFKKDTKKAIAIFLTLYFFIFLPHLFTFNDNRKKDIEQATSNKIIERFIIGERKRTGKITYELSISNGKSAKIIADYSLNRFGKIESPGFYSIKQTTNSYNEKSEGDIEVAQILKFVTEEFEKKENSFNLESKGLALYSKGQEIWGCYLLNQGLCTSPSGREQIKVSTLKNSNPKCECKQYHATLKNGTIHDGAECTIESPSSCAAEVPTIISNDLSKNFPEKVPEEFKGSKLLIKIE